MDIQNLITPLILFGITSHIMTVIIHLLIFIRDRSMCKHTYDKKYVLYNIAIIAGCCLSLFLLFQENKIIKIMNLGLLLILFILQMFLLARNNSQPLCK